MERLAETAGITKTQAATMTGEAKVGGGWDFIAKIRADGSAAWRGQTMERETWDRVKDYAAAAPGDGAVVAGLGGVAALLDARGDGRPGEPRRELVREPHAHAALRGGGRLWPVRNRRAGRSRRRRCARKRRRSGASSASPSSPGCRSARARTGAPSAPRARRASPRRRRAEDAEQLREYAAAFIAEKFPAPAGPDPAAVGGAAQYEGAAGELRGAYARETAAAHGGWAEGVRDRAYVAGAPIPGEVDAAARGERAETRAGMTVNEAGREARAGIAREDAREGRAGVAVQAERPFEEHATENLPLVGDWLAQKLYGTARNAVPDGSEDLGPADPRRTRGRRRHAARLGRGPPEVAPWRVNARRESGRIGAGESAQVIVVVQVPVFEIAHPRIAARAGVPVESLAVAVGEIAGAEGGRSRRPCRAGARRQGLRARSRRGPRATPARVAPCPPRRRARRPSRAPRRPGPRARRRARARWCGGPNR